MPILVRMQEGTEIERLEARIELYEKMITMEQENIRRLRVSATPHLADLTRELREMHHELKILKQREKY